MHIKTILAYACAIFISLFSYFLMGIAICTFIIGFYVWSSVTVVVESLPIFRLYIWLYFAMGFGLSLIACSGIKAISSGSKTGKYLQSYIVVLVILIAMKIYGQYSAKNYSLYSFFNDIGGGMYFERNDNNEYGYLVALLLSSIYLIYYDHITKDDDKDTDSAENP